MKKTISLMAALALAGTTMIACGKSPVTTNSPTDKTPVKVVNLTENSTQSQFANVPENYTHVTLEEEVQIHEFIVRIYSYKNDGLDGFFLTDQMGHTFNLYGEDEYYVNENFNISFGSTKRFDDAYLWVYPEEDGFLTVCHPNK